MEEKTLSKLTDKELAWLIGILSSIYPNRESTFLNVGKVLTIICKLRNAQTRRGGYR